MQEQTIKVLVMLRDLVIGTIFTSAHFLILFQSKYSLLRSTSKTASVGMIVVITSRRGLEYNSKHLSHHLPYRVEGSKVW